jgi:hypothetical protein
VAPAAARWRLLPAAAACRFPDRAAGFPCTPVPAVFSIFNFHFTYCLTLIHTLTTLVGMQGFLQVSGRQRAGGCEGTGSTAAPRGPLLLLLLVGVRLIDSHALPPYLDSRHIAAKPCAELR